MFNQNEIIIGIHEQRYIFAVTKHILWTFQQKYISGQITQNNFNDELQLAFNQTHIALLASFDIINNEVYKLIYIHSSKNICPFRRRYRIAVTKARLKRDMYNLRRYIENEYMPTELTRIVLCGREGTIYKISNYEPPDSKILVCAKLAKDIKEILAICVKDWLQTKKSVLTGKFWLNDEQQEMLSEETW